MDHHPFTEDKRLAMQQPPCKRSRIVGPEAKVAATASTRDIHGRLPEDSVREVASFFDLKTLMRFSTCSRTIRNTVSHKNNYGMWMAQRRNLADGVVGPFMANKLVSVFMSRSMTVSCAELLMQALRLKPSEMADVTEKAIQSAADTGVFDLARWCVRTFGLARVSLEPGRLFAKACCQGHISAAKWIARALRIYPSDFGYDSYGDTSESASELVSEVCKKGHLGVARWLLTDVFDDVWHASRWAFNESGEENQTLPHEDYSVGYLTDALVHKHIELATWLAECFPYAPTRLAKQMQYWKTCDRPEVAQRPMKIEAALQDAPQLSKLIYATP